MSEVLIRKATSADLPRIAAIWYDATTEGTANPPPARGVPSLYLHELETQELFVLEDDNEVRGYAAVISRGDIAYLADLFVHSVYRSAGLGRRLLDAVLATDGRLCCTVASNDPRALPLYIRSGMRPYWPHVHLRAQVDQLGAEPTLDVVTVEAAADDSDWVRWDREISGRPRPQDHKYWIERRRGVPLWFRRAGRTIGYGMAQCSSDDSVWYPDMLTLGPIGTLEREHAVDCVLSAAHWARARAHMLRIVLTGPHPALAPLLTTGFRIVEVETFCSNRSQPFVDIERYVSSGDDLF
jgi:ribosomal protein S18 acetylase RimI-like enzyme